MWKTGVYEALKHLYWNCVEGDEFDGKDTKYVIYIDPVGNASVNMAVAGYMGL